MTLLAAWLWWRNFMRPHPYQLEVYPRFDRAVGKLCSMGAMLRCFVDPPDLVARVVHLVKWSTLIEVHPSWEIWIYSLGWVCLWVGCMQSIRDGMSDLPFYMELGNERIQEHLWRSMYNYNGNMNVVFVSFVLIKAILSAWNRYFLIPDAAREDVVHTASDIMGDYFNTTPNGNYFHDARLNLTQNIVEVFIDEKTHSRTVRDFNTLFLVSMIMAALLSSQTSFDVAKILLSELPDDENVPPVQEEDAHKDALSIPEEDKREDELRRMNQAISKDKERIERTVYPIMVPLTAAAIYKLTPHSPAFSGVVAFAVQVGGHVRARFADKVYSNYTRTPEVQSPSPGMWYSIVTNLLVSSTVVMTLILQKEFDWVETIFLVGGIPGAAVFADATRTLNLHRRKLVADAAALRPPQGFSWSTSVLPLVPALVGGAIGVFFGRSAYMLYFK